MTLKQLRMNSGLKAYKIAELIGISRRHLIRIENGESKCLSEISQKLSKIYRLPLNKILKSAEETWNERNN